jgi:hypothetical protein
MTYNRKDLAVQVNIKALRGYTMADIGELDDRIKRLEYYTVLNALSLDTKTLSIRDDTGTIERFKNGIFADPFNDHTLGRTEDREYAINVSSQRSIALPRYTAVTHDFKYQPTASSGIKITGRLATLNYVNEKLGGNPYASIYRNVTEGMYSYRGSLQLYPNYDSGKSVIAGAPQNINIDIAGAFKSLLATGIAQTIDTEVGGNKLVNSSSTSSGYVTTTVNQYSQTTATTVHDIAVDIQQVPVSIGPVVQDVSILPYMKSRMVGIVARGLKPNTTIHCYFDKVSVDMNVAASIVNSNFADINGNIDNTKLSSLVAGQENLLVLPTGPLGGPFKTNSKGEIYLTFIIPDNTFRTGDRTFVITNVDDINATQAILTWAEGIYSANALSVKTKDISFNMMQPSFHKTTDTTYKTKTWSTTSTVDNTPPPNSGSCFVKGSLVKMADGSIKLIEEVEIGDQLLGHSQVNNVVGFDHQMLDNNARSPDLYGINGMGRLMTSEHPVLTTDGWKSVNPSETERLEPEIYDLIIGKLEVGDEIICEDGTLTVTSIDEYLNEPQQQVYNFKLDGDHTYIVNNMVVHNKHTSDPIAETFTIQDASAVDVPGAYITQVGVYFKSKSPTLGITMYLCDTTIGIPDSSRVYGKAYLTQDLVGISDDSSVETVFTFESPVLLQTDATYSFYLVPDGDNPDYEIWISEVGGTDKLTNSAINTNPFAGIMYTSNNGKSWTPYQSQDIKFNLYRARFTSASGTAIFSNETEDYLTLQNLSRYTSGGGIQVGHAVYAANSANLNQTFTDTTVYPFGVVSSVDELNNILYLTRSNGLFSNTTYGNIRIYNQQDYANVQQIIPANLVANAQIKTIDDLKYHQIAPKFAVMEPSGSGTVFKYYGTSNSTSSAGSFYKDTTPIVVNNEQITQFLDYERVLRSYSNEVAQGGFGSAGNSTVEVDLYTENNYVSPVIDLATKSVKLFENIISSNNVNEHTRYGYALNRYLGQVVSLNKPAEDLRVYVTGYRPSGSEIEIYIKFKSSGDTENFDDKAWTKLIYINNDGGKNTGLLYSNKPDDYKELIYGVPKVPTPICTDATISGTTLTLTTIVGAGNSVTQGQFKVGQTIVGNGVKPGTVITALGTGTGQAGTYTINNSHGSIGPIEVKATPNSPSANVAYGDSCADIYTNNQLPRNTLSYFNNAYAYQTMFSQFAIKVLLLSNNPILVPNMRDVRAIATML